MVSWNYLIIVIMFIIYYLVVLVSEKRMIYEPTEIIKKFLAVLLAYAGISLIYFSITGKPVFGSEISEYYVYIFLIGFISLVWAIPTLLSEFKFFKKFMKKRKK